jgi:hypothetical protein
MKFLKKIKIPLLAIIISSVIFIADIFSSGFFGKVVRLFAPCRDSIGNSAPCELQYDWFLGVGLLWIIGLSLLSIIVITAFYFKNNWKFMLGKIGEEELVFKKIVGILCFFGGILIFIYCSFFIFPGYLAGNIVKEIFSAQSALPLVSLLLISSGAFFINKTGGKLKVFVKSYILNFLILSLFELALIYISIFPHLRENFSEDMFLSFFLYLIIFFSYSFLPAILRTTLNVSGKYLILSTIVLGIIIVLEAVLNLSAGNITMIIFGILLLLISPFLKKADTRAV